MPGSLCRTFNADAANQLHNGATTFKKIVKRHKTHAKRTAFKQYFPKNQQQYRSKSNKKGLLLRQPFLSFNRTYFSMPSTSKEEVFIVFKL